ncbi:hypothetical protein BX616_003790, partial [Lobosporangium transversale]
IQDALSRVSSKQDNMTAEERQILQYAQMMKNLAEEVIIINHATESRRNMDTQSTQSLTNDTRTKLLSLTIPTSATPSHVIEPTETPPPTASTPSTAFTFQVGNLRHRSSTASFTSSSNSDRQYTQDSEERLSRPCSAASSYRHRQKSKSRHSLRQLESFSDGKNSCQGAESSDAFDRICSLLTELITDASTAVSTAPDGSQQPTDIPLPHFSPLVQSESELSIDSASDEEEVNDTNSIGEEPEDIPSIAAKEPEDPFLRRLHGPKGIQLNDGGGVEVELEPVDRYRTGFRSHVDKTHKRLSSLFMELQSTQTIQDATPKAFKGHRRISSEVDLMEKDKLPRRPRRSISSSLPVSSVHSSRPGSVCWPTEKIAGKSESTTSSISPPEPQLSTRKPRQRASISTFRPEYLQKQLVEHDNQQIDAELDHTVKAIDGLMKDLVAVATHQNWIQMRLQKTLQFQKEQIQQIERTHLTSDVASLAGDQSTLSCIADDISSEDLGLHPLAELLKSLKQVTINVGKVLASSASNPTTSRKQSISGHHAQIDFTEKQHKNRLAGKGFSRYFQELEKIAVIGSRIGFVRGDMEGAANINQNNKVRDQSSKISCFKSVSRDASCNRNSTATLIEEEFAPIPDGLKFNQRVDSDVESIKGEHSWPQLHRESTPETPPELEDFASQCRLLTRALILPFIQLTHHAMSSQDSTLALTPRSSKFSDTTQDLDSTLEIVQSLEKSQSPGDFSAKPHASSVTGTSKLSSSNQKKSRDSLSSTNWAPPISFSGRNPDSILENYNELPPDAIVKVKAVISTGLYLLHLLYWTILFIIGTVILDPWLAETAGQQIVRVVDQVREVIVKDKQSSGHIVIHAIDQQQQHQQQNLHHKKIEGHDQKTDLASTDPLALDQDEQFDICLDQSRLQAHEDRAIEIAVGFESLKQRLSNMSFSQLNSRPLGGQWSNQADFGSIAAALSSTTTMLDNILPNSKEMEKGSSPLSSTTSSSTCLSGLVSMNVGSAKSVSQYSVKQLPLILPPPAESMEVRRKSF